MERRKWYIKEIVRIISAIDDPTVLMKIYTVARTHLDILNGKYLK